MSIFKKILLLFGISLILMIFVSNRADNLTQNSFETILKQKYMQLSNDFFRYLADADEAGLQKKLKELNFEQKPTKISHLKNIKILYDYKTDLSEIKIFKDEEDYLYLYMKYLDDDILLFDTLQIQSHKEKKFLDYLIGADIVITIIMFLIILKILYPLKKISKTIEKFGKGEFEKRVDIKSNDEIGKLASTFNTMAKNTQELIDSKQRLLRDIGHELRTPIARSKLALEMIDEDKKYKDILKRALIQMDEMTNELLSLEKLSQNKTPLNLTEFDVETLLGNALSKLLIDCEEDIEIEIESNFKLKADLKYLSIALKNLIDNGLKYSTKKPIYIVAKNNHIEVRSQGEKLQKPLEFYCEVFTQEDSSREQKGYGLGLSIVKRVLDRHNYTFWYLYKSGYNIFEIKTYI